MTDKSNDHYTLSECLEVISEHDGTFNVDVPPSVWPGVSFYFQDLPYRMDVYDSRTGPYLRESIENSIQRKGWDFFTGSLASDRFSTMVEGNGFRVSRGGPTPLLSLARAYVARLEVRI